MKRKVTKWQPQEWQLNPESLKTEKVQVWSAGGTMMSCIGLEDAKERVRKGSCFVICDQAISYFLTAERTR